MDAYLGAEPTTPWQYGKEPMAPESWPAGSRIIHCFVGQWGEADDLLTVDVPARA